LITVKGKKSIETADIILYDRLVNPELLEYASITAQLIYCGKDPNHKSVSQVDTNQLLVDLAQEGHTITRLQGGDAFVYGGGGEEAEVLAANNITFEIVPCLT